MKITLPNNNLGAAIMLIAIVLVGLVPFVLTLWLMLKIAPWWVAMPVAFATSFVTLLFAVKLRPNH